jgi:hypothetical protein
VIHAITTEFQETCKRAGLPCGYGIGETHTGGVHILYLMQAVHSARLPVPPSRLSAIILPASGIRA